MTGYTAAWVVPISDRPIRRGWITVDRGRILARGGPGDAPAGVTLHDLGDAILMPGLVNAHTHLELSHLRHVIPPASSFVAWVRQLIAIRTRFPDPRDPRIMAGVVEGIAEARQTGTTLVGDISNTLVTVDALGESRLGATVFYELLGFRVTDADAVVTEALSRVRRLTAGRVRVSLAAHAPYSVAPALYPAIRTAAEQQLDMPCSVHLSESPEEVQFIRSGDGPWRETLEQIGVWNPDWQVPGCSPVEYIDRHGFLGTRTLAAHGVQMTDADLARLAARGSTLVTCPRSNVYVGAGSPPIARFYASGVRVAVGTDSLASTTDLNLFSELAAMRSLAPSVAAAAILDSGTRQGAMALGFASDYGTLDPGRRADVLVVDVPAAAGGGGDVEEYLLSGIDASRLRWLDAD